MDPQALTAMGDVETHRISVDEESGAHRAHGPSIFEREAAIRAMPPASDDPLLQVLAAMRMGAILAAIDGRVAYLNDAARESLGLDLGLVLRGDRVAAVLPDARRRLAAALHNACRAPFADAAVLLGPARGSGAARPLRVLSIGRITGGVPGPVADGGDGLALLCLGSARLRAPEPAVLAQLFGLTGAESLLMAGIAGGSRLAECAARRGVSLATVRAQLRNVFVKTGAATQADLTFIAWSIPGLWIN